MNIESQVCSLELAKELKELGVKQESLFYYHCYKKNREWATIETSIEYESGSEEFNDGKWELKIYAAYTPAELGEMLPNSVSLIDKYPFNNFRIIISKYISLNDDLNVNNYFIVNYECGSTEISGENAWLKRYLTKNMYDPNLANAMAMMLIYLIENNLIEVADVNKDN